MELSELMETPPTDVTGFGPPASDSGLPLPADADITAKKTGGCKTSTVEHSDSPTLRLGGKSNQSMGAELDPRDPAPGNYYHTDPMRPTRPRATPPDARDIGLPSTGRRAYSKLTGTLLATVAAAPVALAVRGFRGTASSPKTMGRVLVLLAMISTASGWKLPSHYETLDGQITQRDDRTVDVGEEETEEMIRVSRVTTITEHESPITRDRRRLASSCNGWCVPAPPVLPAPSVLPAPPILPSLAKLTAAFLPAATHKPVQELVASATVTRITVVVAMAATVVAVAATVFLGGTAAATAVGAATTTATFTMHPLAVLATARAVSTIPVATNSATPAAPPAALLVSTAPQSTSLVARVPWPSRHPPTHPTRAHRAP